MTNINWGLLGNYPDAGEAFQQGYEQGKARRTNALTGEAMQAILQDPNGGGEQINALARLAPDKAAALLQIQQKQQDRARDSDFRKAQADYVGTFGPQGGTAINALMPFASRQPAAPGTVGSDGGPPLSAAPPPPGDWQARVGPEGMAALSSTPANGVQDNNAPMTPYLGGKPLQTLDPSADLGLGAEQATPATPTPGAQAGDEGHMPAAIARAAQSPNMETRNRAFLAMSKIDPIKAMKIDSEMRDAALDRLEDANKAYRFAVARLPMVKDDAGYQQVLSQVDALLTPLGMDIRQTVPATYPGPEGTRQLLMQAMEAQQQLEAMDRRFTAEANVADDAADNARADRNTDNIIANRNARTSLSTERERRMAANAGRGGKRKGRKGKKAGGTSIVNPTTGERMILKGGQWVPAQ